MSWASAPLAETAVVVSPRGGGRIRDNRWEGGQSERTGAPTTELLGKTE
ncbi:hypothetical protein B8V81_3618 [Paenibacillus pasadenensis]|uniref:Uncharacterized protein n=1 Tax=Paenibacillus pasadenensis TaxID=217090 RepID=A0A2N5N4B1_9BACL|nr:hypothetical protein B8V81_3618 [Paenibacillus pasadenensis]